MTCLVDDFSFSFITIYINTRETKKTMQNVRTNFARLTNESLSTEETVQFCAVLSVDSIHF